MPSTRRPPSRRPVGRAGPGDPRARTSRGGPGQGPAAPPRTSRATDVADDLSEQRRRAPLTGRAAIFAVVLVVLVLSFAYPLRSWFDQRAQVAELHERTVAQQREIADLTAAIERWDDPKFVEAQARQRLRFVMPGDAPFVVVEKDEAAAAADVADRGAAGDWWQRLWSTVEEADHPPEDLVADPADAPADPSATEAPATGAPADAPAELPAADGAG